MWIEEAFVLKKKRLGSHLYAFAVLTICKAPPYVLNPFHPKLPLSLLSPVSLPLVYPPRSFLSLARCLLTSCAQMAERNRWDGFVWRVRALKHPGHTYAHGVWRRDSLQQGSGAFVPESKDVFLFSFSSLPCARRVRPRQYETDAPNSHVTQDKHGLWSEKVRNLGFFPALIGLEFLFCASG